MVAPDVMTSQKGAVLELSRQQIGLMADVDLSGLAITLRRAGLAIAVTRRPNPKAPHGGLRFANPPYAF